MRNKTLIGLVMTTLMMSGTSYAFNANVSAPNSPAQAQTSAEYAKLRANLSSNLGLQVVKITPSPIKGIVEVITEQGLFYVSEDGKYFMHGKLYGIEDGVFNHTEESLAKVRINGMKEFNNDMIVFPAKNEKHVVTVFTDITCGYCRRMHDQIGEYNDKGITVRYLAYPRSGIRDQQGNYAQGFKDLQSIWCHEDPADALTKAKLGAQVAQRICDSKVEAEFNFGRQIGVNGTPAIILENGLMLPGYQTPDNLLQIITEVKSDS